MVAAIWRRAETVLAREPGFAEAFLPGGRAPAAGELFVNKPLAASLRAIAETRGEAFYRGALAERIAAFAREHGAALTVDDLADHRNDWCGTIAKAFGEVALHEIPPNGQGIAACMALGILRHVGLTGHEPDSVEALHLEIEAMKLAFRDVMAYVGDASAMTEVTPAHLLDDGYLASRAKLIDPDRARDFGSGAPRFGGTVYLAAADESGMMVSYIQSNYFGFGSGVVVPGTGISLQNRGFGFVTAKGHPNRVGPRKRPFHTIIPGFLMKGSEPLMSFGVMGGPMQAQGHLQMTLRTQLWGQDPQTAADAPRWRVLSGPRGRHRGADAVRGPRGARRARTRDQRRAAGCRLRVRRRAADPSDSRRLCRGLRPPQGRAGGRLLNSRSAAERQTMTWSIIARDAAAGQIGIAVATCAFAVGARVPFIETGVGAVATQSFVNPFYGPRGLQLMRVGVPVEDVVRILTHADEGRSQRQVHVMDAAGRFAAYTGEGCVTWCGHLIGDTFSVAGNMLSSAAVIEETARAYGKGTGLPFPQRLLAAMHAGEACGRRQARQTIRGAPDPR